MTNQPHFQSTGNRSALPDIRELRATFRGPVIVPGDDEYDRARAIFYGGFDRKPAAILRVQDSTDVARAIRLARDSGLELAVRSGGHSNAGFGVTEGGIVVDLSQMKALTFDAAERRAWAETGLTAIEYTRAASEHNLATGFGDTGSVGIGGITLGGGVGYLVRKHGLTIDDLLAAEVVTAGGEILQVDADHHPDLFWAIRGGGGNFGVATRFQYRLHELDRVHGGMLVLPATPETISGMIAAAEAAPEELSAIINVMKAPPMPFLPPEAHGKLIIMALLLYAGPLEDAERAIAPFKALATPLADMLHPMRYPEIYPPEDPSYHPTGAVHTFFMDNLDRNVAETIVDRLQASTAMMAVAQLRVLGGAMARVPAEATAFAHRGRRIMANVAALVANPADVQTQQAWADSFAADLSGRPGAYVNFLANEGEERVREAYPGATWDKLAAVKRSYDPTNLFRLNQNISPK
jgi:FAD/FMN-containing dehydrogenase